MPGAAVDHLGVRQPGDTQDGYPPAHQDGGSKPYLSLELVRTPWPTSSSGSPERPGIVETEAEAFTRLTEQD
jgi:hypothetical protein